MNDFDQFERRLGAALRSDADERVGPFEAESIARAAIAGTERGAMRLPRSSSRPAGRFGRGRGMTLLAAAALLLVGGAFGGLRLPTAAVGRPACPCPIGDRGRHGVARCDVPEPERPARTIGESRHERLHGSAGRPERAVRSTGLDPGKSEGGLARAGPPRARWRRERPTDASHVRRSYERHGIRCVPVRRHPLGDSRHQPGVPQTRLETAAVVVLGNARMRRDKPWCFWTRPTTSFRRGSQRAVDRVWRRDR